jgi:hypothetical protein
MTDRKIAMLLGYSQATPSRLSDKDRMKVKAVEWLQVVTRDKGTNNLIFWLMAKCIMHNAYGGLHSKAHDFQRTA